METVLITGGTGLVGSALSGYLIEKGYKVIIMSRKPNPEKENKHVDFAAWNIESQQIDLNALKRADHIIHLSGAGVVDKRWSKAYKNEIIKSRTQSSKLLVDTLMNIQHNVKSVICASGIGWYGPDKISDHAFREEEPASGDFLGQTCLAWEESISKAELAGVKVCKIRTGIVLSDKGGALSEFVKPLRFGIATILGNGHQNISWIHIEDLCRLYHHAITSQLSGSFNGVSPKPVTNKKLILQIARLTRPNAFIPIHVPSFLLKIIMGESSVEVLKSTTASSEKISKTGFAFLYPSIDAALSNLIKKR